MSPNDVFTATAAELQPVLAELLAREPIFHRPAFASTPDDFARLMTPDYWEVGASGRRYSRSFILDSLTRNPPVDAGPANWRITAPQCRQLGPETYLLTYTLDQPNRPTRRTTIWQRTATSWRILYHQGTVITSNQDDIDP